MPRLIAEKTFGVVFGGCGALGALGAFGALGYGTTATFLSGGAFAVACLALARAEFAVRIARAGLNAPMRPLCAEERSVRALHDLVQHFAFWWSTVVSSDPSQSSAREGRVDDECLRRGAYTCGRESATGYCASEAGSDESELVRAHATVDPNEWVHAALRAATPSHERVSEDVRNGSNVLARRRLPQITETRLSRSPTRVR